MHALLVEIVSVSVLMGTQLVATAARGDQPYWSALIAWATPSRRRSLEG